MEENKGIPGVFEVVESKSLHHMTAAGWELVQVLPELVVVREEQRNYNGRETTVEPPVMGPGHRYLIRKNPESELAVLQEKNSQLHADLVKARNELQAANTRVKELDDKSYGLGTAVKLKDERIDLLSKKIDEFRERASRMERDLGAVRKEIGEREFNRITGKDEPK